MNTIFYLLLAIGIIASQSSVRFSIHGTDNQGRQYSAVSDVATRTDTAKDSVPNVR